MPSMKTGTKRLLAISCLLGALLGAQAAYPAGKKGDEGTGAAAAPAAKDLFLVKLIPTTPGAEATEEQKARIMMHFDHLKSLQARGALVLAGMSTDVFEGLLVLKAADRAQAEEMLVNDPAVAGGIYKVELHPFQIVLSGPSR
jgi:uncharacterized protein YciI